MEGFKMVLEGIFTSELLVTDATAKLVAWCIKQDVVFDLLQTFFPVMAAKHSSCNISILKVSSMGCMFFSVIAVDMNGAVAFA